MGIEVNGFGIIVVVCHKCGFKLYWYAIGDSSNRSKFSGPPTPAKALSGYDGGHCPLCGTKLSKKPSKLIFMTQKEFNERYAIGKYKLTLRKPVQQGLIHIAAGIANVEEREVELQALEA